MEPFFPLKVFICHACYLVQLPEVQTPEEIFSDYAYFSSYSDTWLRHSEVFAKAMVSRFGIDPGWHVVEIASNDGYLLRYFKGKKIPVLGIEPARNVAKTAIESGIPTVTEFFGVRTANSLAAEGKKADLLIGNNVLAHVPEINDFVEGMKVLLNSRGVITMEFPHLLRLIEGNQFDTIYHEHFSYFSFVTVEKIFGRHGIVLFDVEEIPTHGGSLRIYARHAEDSEKPLTPRVHELRNREVKTGMTDIRWYQSFHTKVAESRRNILEFIIRIRKEGRSIVGYGAPAKGNTLLNYCGLRTDFIEYTVDRSLHKQGLFLPGTHIPIFHPEKVRETRPDYLLILPWNIKEEIMAQMGHIREWGGRFIVLIPEVMVAP
jgi:2-polyprenyl-3-methyl-5-hydroxy-6-metoxy-1,4-benzoquinol methylase